MKKIFVFNVLIKLTS